MNLFTQFLSERSGLPEPPLRLLLTVLLGFPAAVIYNYLFGQNAQISTTKDGVNLSHYKIYYILGAGILLNYFFNSFYIYHSLLTISVTYGLLYILGEQTLKNRFIANVCVWIFNAVYLLLGYYYMQTDDYDITWTMTHCVLCLRLMGFGFDYYDAAKHLQKKVAEGTVNPVGLEAEVKQTAVIKEDENTTTTTNQSKKTPSSILPLSFLDDTPLFELPNILEVFAYCLFPSAFLVGPQFSFSLFKKWINNETQQELTTLQKEETYKIQIVYVLRSVALAALYLGIQQTIGTQYSTSYLLTEEYRSLNFINRLFILCLAGKFAYMKYIGIWLLTEGSVALFGISYDRRNYYNTVDKKNVTLFSGLANTKPALFETATSIDHIILSFNINTNLWTKYYVFKRLRFLGNKNLSQFGTLAFLAIWHGFHTMYFVTFLLEFVYVQAETVLRERLVVPYIYPFVGSSDNSMKKGPLFYAWKIIAWATCQFTVTYAVVGFELLKVHKSIAAYQSVYFVGHIPALIVLALHKILPKPMSMKKKVE